MSLKRRLLLFLSILLIVFTILNLSVYIYLSKRLFDSGKIDTFLISASIMSRLLDEKGDKECYQVISDRKLFEYMPVAIAKIYKDGSFDYLCGTVTDIKLVKWAMQNISGRYGFFYYRSEYTGIFNDSNSSDGSRYLIIFGYEKDINNFRKLKSTIIFFDTILFTIMGVVIYLLIRRLYLKPFEYLTERLKSAPLADEFIKEIDNSQDELGRILSSVASLIRNLKSEKEELLKKNEELRKAQEDLIRTERLSTLGKIAASIAHEVGTPLGTVRGYIDLINKGIKTNRTENINEYLNKMDNEIVRISNILKELLDYARPPRFNIVDETINRIISEAISFLMMQKSFKEMKIHFNCSIDFRALVDRDRIKQILINLLMNSRDATEGKGNVWIGLGANDKWTIITIRDDGCGIKEGDKNKIFEPFYTTKPSGQGSGLGLAIVKKLIDSMDGKIEFDSHYGKWTEFRIFLKKPQ